MDITLREKLIEYGLTDKEARVYLSALELGSASVNKIARKSNTFRTYCYDILKSLMEKGLISYIVKKGVKYYEAVDPDRLVSILREKEERINAVLPQLKLLKASAVERPATEVFEGREGIKALHMDILKTGQDHLVLGSADKIVELLGSWFNIYIKERVKKKIKARVIVEDSPLTRELILKPAKRQLRNIRFYKTKKAIETTTYIYGDKIGMVMYGKEVFGVIIHSKELADTEKILFEALWNDSIIP